MDFEVTYTEEQQRFRQEVRGWLAEHVPPSITRTPVSDEDNYRRYLELRALGRKLGAKGWLYPRAPAAYGGGGLDLDHAIILEEEVDRLDLSLPPYYDSGGRLGAPSILVWAPRSRSARSCRRSTRARCARGSSSPSPAPAPISPACA